MPGARYSPAFKEKMVEKLLRPNGPSTYALARESGVPQSTLSRWLQETRTLDGMKKQRKGTSKRRTTEDKVRIVQRASELSDEELGAFLREEGVHTAELERWREAVHEAFGKKTPEARRRSQMDSKRIRALERELKRKDKALAESAALLWLKKKASDIWGDEDDDTPSRNGG